MTAGFLSAAAPLGSTIDWLESTGDGEEHCSFPGCSLMLVAAELPGVYVDIQRERVFVLDHFEARLADTPSGKTLEVSNPTSYPATVKLLMESSEQQKQRLGPNSFLNWKTLTLAPCGRQRVPITP